MNRDDVVGLAGLDKHWRDYGMISKLKLDPVREYLTANTAHSVCREIVDSMAQIQSRRGGRAHNCGVVPGEFV